MRKGVSPIIATVLLIAITVTLAAIIFSSSNSFIAQLAPAPDCEKISFNAGLYKTDKAYVLEVNNIGNDIIEGFNLIIQDKSLGQTDIQKVDLVVNPGQSKSKEIDLESIDKKEFILVPIIKNAKDTPLACDNSFGIKLNLN